MYACRHEPVWAGFGVTTAFAQRLLTQKVSLPTHKQLTPAPFGISAQAIFTQHQQTVKALTWSPDEQMLASGGNDHLTLVWQLDGTLLRTHMLDAHVRALAWSPNGLQLVAGAGTTVTFFDAHTGTQLARNTEHHTDVVTALGWVQGPSGLLHAVSAGADKKAIVWNGQSHQPERTFRRHTAAIEALTTLQGTVVTASQGGVARVWNATSGQEIHGYYFDTQQTLRAVAFSSGGALATGSDDGLIHLWSDGRTCIRQVQDAFGMHCVDTPIRLQGHTHPVQALAFSPDGTLLASGGEDRHLIIWSIPKKTPLLIQKQQEGLTALAWSPSGQVLAEAVGTRVMLWRIHQ
ncbi:WD40 repeat domain-containing protein [Ktedonospora formicarum]|uniref:Anaphase-promoting complex subunit 4 WD40 domain-containing protein n=1 Tax=Ktedonospora formicarum TaxID=2778364 RepID=A0A8J3IDL9_9CHLR|nr:WD40 repeat domain-containing protein [Ktedonospora formicarum]GHO50812.1 hypothetical protein KSX_89750 [Ktedonospora formicarum]